MPFTLDQVRRLLAPDELNSAQMAGLGPQLLPHLKALVASGDNRDGPKAAYVASLIDHEQTVEILRAAARSTSPLLRSAAASGARNVKRPGAAGILAALLDDRDAVVRKVAIKSSVLRPNAALLSKLNDLTKRDPSPAIRAVARTALQNRGGRRVA